MADLHIDDFYRDAALILLRLFGTFPRKQLLYVEDLHDTVEFDEFGLPEPRYQACFSTMLWLAEEGWLRYESTVRQEALDQVVLTGAAFLRLTAVGRQPGAEDRPADMPPSVAAAARSRITALRRVVASGDSIAISRCTHELLASRATTDRQSGS